MGPPNLQDYDPAALILAAVAVVIGAVLLGMTIYHDRRRSARRATTLPPQGRLDIVARDLDRIAETSSGVSQSEPEAWQLFERGLAATAACHWIEALRLFEAAKTAVAGRPLASLFHQAGVCRYMLGDLNAALREFQEAARLAEQLRDTPARARAINNIGVIRHDFGELATACGDLRKARALARESANPEIEALCLGNIGNVFRDKGEGHSALRLQENALAMARQIVDPRGVAVSLANIGSVLRDRGELDRAQERYEAALDAARKIDDKLGAGVALGNIGCLQGIKGEMDRALKTHEAALALAREVGFRLGIATELANIGLILVGTRAHDRAVAYLAESLTTFLAAGAANGHRQAIYGLSRCDDSLGRDRMRELLQESGLAEAALADTLDRIDQIRSRRPWQRGTGRNPFGPVPASPQLSGA
jgi:tetratricopeptide (TPR) repeat protein